MPNLQLATYIGQQNITPGSAFVLDIHVHESGANNFNWTGYTPKARLHVGSVAISVSGTVVSAGGGTATFTWTAAQTATLAYSAWGAITLFADPTANAENLYIADIDVQTNSEVIP
jgi:hypothetical protein